MAGIGGWVGRSRTRIRSCLLRPEVFLEGRAESPRVGGLDTGSRQSIKAGSRCWWSLRIPGGPRGGSWEALVSQGCWLRDLCPSLATGHEGGHEECWYERRVLREDGKRRIWVLMGTRQGQGRKEPGHLLFLDVPVFECLHVSFAVSLSLSLHSPSVVLFNSVSASFPSCRSPRASLTVSSSLCLCGQRLGPRPEAGGGSRRTAGRG